MRSEEGKARMEELIEEPPLLRSYITGGTPDAVVARYAGLPHAAKISDYGELDHSIVVLDTETTGLSINHDELTQIAAARMEKGEIVEWYVTFVNPGKPIPEDVAHLTNIHDEDVADAPTPSEALAQLAEFVGDSKVVAHNATFDRNFTTRHPEGYPLLENTWIDSLDLARIALPRMKSHRLIDLVKAFGAPVSTHRADDDVAATCALFRILLAAVDAMPLPLIREIATMATPEEWPTSTVFSFFARRKSEKERIELGLSEDEYKPATFSIRSMRRARCTAVERKAKRDALALMRSGEEGVVFPTEQEIANAFSESGLVGDLYEAYERRDEQLAMAQGICAAFSESNNLLVEAGTGVGKSMAYLVPEALTALGNNITVGVATKTNALLDQLIYKELPALSSAIEKRNPGVTLTYASLKGFTHYPCLRRIDRLVSNGPTMRLVGNEERHQAPSLAALLSYIEQTEYDDMDGLKIDYRTLPRRSITTTSRECFRRKCPYFGTTCFVHGSRRIAEAADIVVTNHTLLFCDIAAEGALLPPIRYWVVDEAHGAEKEARAALSKKLSVDDLNYIALRVSADEAARNIFENTERTVTVSGSEENTTLFYSLLSKAKAAGRDFAEAEKPFAEHVRDLLFFDPAGKKNRSYEYVDLWINDEIRASETFKAIAGFGERMVDAAEKLIKCSQELVAYLEELDDHAATRAEREIASIALELKEAVKAADIILFSGGDAFVYSATLCRKADRGGNRLEALLYNVGNELNETLYANTESVVFTSATLTVNGSFDSFENAMGLNGPERRSRCSELILDSSYDFDNQMTVYVANDIPEPNDARYLPELQKLLVALHRAQHGSMLTLFTNRREMESCFEEVQPELKQDDLRLVCQKWGVSVKGLRDDFLADEHLSLFALKSFWEGFDAPGATLKGVVIPKLPFAKPTDPLSCERSARDDQAWRRYVLPAAVLEVKQAAGRLIRKADDEGVLVLADKRLVTKGYGKSFLKSLPSRNIKICSMDEIVEDISARCNR